MDIDIVFDPDSPIAAEAQRHAERLVSAAGSDDWPFFEQIFGEFMRDTVDRPELVMSTVLKMARLTAGLVGCVAERVDVPAADVLSWARER